MGWGIFRLKLGGKMIYGVGGGLYTSDRSLKSRPHPSCIAVISIQAICFPGFNKPLESTIAVSSLNLASFKPGIVEY